MTSPNILIVCTDQQRKDTLSCYGNKLISTSGFDFIEKNGWLFNRAYSSSSVCTPSRVSIMTGKYVLNHKIWNVGVNANDTLDFLSMKLASHNYDTYLIGKAHYESFGATSLQSKESIKDWQFGYDNWNGPYYGFENVELALGHVNYGLSGHYGAWVRSKTNKSDFDDYLKLNQVKKDIKFGGEAYDWNLPLELHNSVWTVNKAIEYFDKRNHNKPFFMFLGFQDPHHPHAVPINYKNKVNVEDVELPYLLYNEHDNNPPHYKLAREGKLVGSKFEGNEYHMAGQGIGYDYRLVTDEDARLGKSYYHSMVKIIDDQLMMLWQYMLDKDILENTIVIVTSDHGEMLGDHGLWMKGPFHYEQIINIPFMIMWPATLTSRHVNKLVSHVDIVPTCLKAIFDEINLHDVDGLNLLGEIPDERYVFTETIQDWQSLVCRTIISNQFKLSWFANESFGTLHDLENDPKEINNLWEIKPFSSKKIKLLSEILNFDIRSNGSKLPRISYA